MRILVAAKSEKQAKYVLFDLRKEGIIDWFDEDYAAAMSRSAAITLRNQGALFCDAYAVPDEFEDDPEIVDQFIRNLEDRTYYDAQIFLYEGEAA